MNYSALRGVFLACLMKLCMKITETLFTIEDPSKFKLVESSPLESGGGEQNRWNQTCEFNNEPRANSSLSTATTWIYTSRYVLPVLGGLLSSAFLGYIRVLQIGGAVMLLSTVLLSVAVYLDLMCQASPVIPVTWLLLPLFFGLIQPNILFCTFSWFRKPKFCTIMSAIYLATAVSGENIALQLLPLNKAESLGPHSSIIYIGVSASYIALSFLLPSNQPSQEPFQMPHRLRLTRYFRIFCGLALFLFTLEDTRPMVYDTELKFYLNGTDHMEAHFLLSPKKINLTAMAVCCMVLIVAASISRRQIPIGPRMQAGILLEAAVAASLMIFTAAARPSSADVVLVYTAASILDAIAEVLLMTGAYDLVQQIMPSGAESFVMGIMFTVWGLSNLASRAALPILSGWLQSSETHGMYNYHLVTLVSLLACSAYHRFVALPMAAQVTPTRVSEEDNAEEEQHLLLKFSDALTF